MYVNIFSSSDNKADIQKMADEIISNDIIGMHGGRLHVRKIMREVVDLIEKYNDETIFEDEQIEISCPSSYDHPDTELGYLFNCKKYSYDIAKKAVIRAYDTKK